MPSPQSERGPVLPLVSPVVGFVVVVGLSVVELELLDDSVVSVVDEDDDDDVSGSPVLDELEDELDSDDVLGSVVVDGDVEMLVIGSSVVSLDDAPVSLEPPDDPGSPPGPHDDANSPTPNQAQRIIGRSYSASRAQPSNALIGPLLNPRRPNSWIGEPSSFVTRAICTIVVSRLFTLWLLPSKWYPRRPAPPPAIA